MVQTPTIECLVKQTLLLSMTPNDLLSYGIPSGFAAQYIDARLCSSITNVNINIAKVIDAFELTNIANPIMLMSDKIKMTEWWRRLPRAYGSLEG